MLFFWILIVIAIDGSNLNVVHWNVVQVYEVYQLVLLCTSSAGIGDSIEGLHGLPLLDNYYFL